MMYSRDTISVSDVKDSLLSKELKRIVSRNDETSCLGLFVGMGRTSERDGKKKRKITFKV